MIRMPGWLEAWIRPIWVAALLVVVGAIVGVIMNKWMHERFRRVIQILFRIGPVLLLVPLLLWTLAWTNILTGEANDDEKWYIVPPMQDLVVLAVLWHIALVVAEKGRRVLYLVYAILHMPAFYVVWIIALVFATHFPV